MSKLTDFLTGAGTDASGRPHPEILALKDASLESLHDFIQWLFPLPEPSAAVPNSPVLTGQDIGILHASETTRTRMRAAAARMLRFYRGNAHWLKAHDHNHLRISRIIRSLRLIVGDADANGFRAAILGRVAETNAPISALTLSYWNAA